MLREGEWPSVPKERDPGLGIVRSPPRSALRASKNSAGGHKQLVTRPVFTTHHTQTTRNARESSSFEGSLFMAVLMEIKGKPHTHDYS